MYFASNIISFSEKIKPEKKIAQFIPRPTYNFQGAQISNVQRDHLVPLGGTIGLQVEVKCHPRHVVWYRDSTRIPRYSSRHKMFMESGICTLLFPKATVDDAGTYTCRITHENIHLDTSTIVQIVNPNAIPNGKPALFASRPGKTLCITVGEDITVSCRVTGDPRPTGIIIFLLTIKKISEFRKISNKTY